MRKPKPYTAKDGTVTWSVRHRDLAGRERQATFHTKQDAEWFARTIDQHGVLFAMRTLDQLESEGRQGSGPILRQVFADFIEWKRPYLRSVRTGSDYERDYKATIDPTFGHEPVDSITPEMVTAWVDAMVSGKIVSAKTKKAMSPKTIAGRHALLHQIMAYAVDRKLTLANPCTGVTLPNKVKPTPKGLMPAEWQALYAALTTIDADAADLAFFLVGSGWRWGEAVALTPAAVEDYGTSLYVTMMQVRRRDDEGAHNIAEDDGKAQKSMRRIKLDKDVSDMIRRRLVGVGIGDAVFTGINQETGERQPWQYGMFQNRWSRAIGAAGLKRRPTVHWLRHTHVAWLAMSGAPLPVIQRRLGHAQITTTIGTYGSMIGDASDDALDALAAMRGQSNNLPAVTEDRALPTGDAGTVTPGGALDQ